MSKLTKNMRALLERYKDGTMNGKPYPVNSFYTRGSGIRLPGLASAHMHGLIVSEPDATLHPNGWRHDITEAGRAALQTEGDLK